MLGARNFGVRNNVYKQRDPSLPSPAYMWHKIWCASAARHLSESEILVDRCHGHQVWREKYQAPLCMFFCYVDLVSSLVSRTTTSISCTRRPEVATVNGQSIKTTNIQCVWGMCAKFQKKIGILWGASDVLCWCGMLLCWLVRRAENLSCSKGMIVGHRATGKTCLIVSMTENRWKSKRR